MGRLEERMEQLEVRVEKLENRMNVLEERMIRLEARMDILEKCILNLDERLRKLELLHENQVLPRVKTIEDCYLATYDRYREGTGQIAGMVIDIEALKLTVQAHTSSLQKIS